VIVPGITDEEGELTRLGQFLGTLRNVKALDVLPYHTMGVSKYRQLGIEYPLEGVEPATKAQAAKARQIILKAYREARGLN
jgi:pyruvate formate lyase activating enzyme